MGKRRKKPEIGKNIKIKIWKRDFFCCQKCGEVVDLEVHHIQPIFYGGDNSLNNLITLCYFCHKYCPDNYVKFLRYMGVPIQYSVVKVERLIKSHMKNLRFFWSELNDAIKSEGMTERQVANDYINYVYSKIPNYKKTYHYRKKNDFFSVNNFDLKDSFNFIFGKLYNENKQKLKEETMLKNSIRYRNGKIKKRIAFKKINKIIEDDPKISFRKLGMKFGINPRTVMKIINK